MKPLINFLILLLCSVFAFSQDLHYSQFYSIPSNANPAFTGFFNNDYFVAGIYKTQWNTVSKPYQTVGATMELSLLKNKFPESYLGTGVEVVHDWAGSTIYTTDIFNFNLSYLHVLDKESRNVLGFGFQNGLVYRKFDLSKATFENQFNGYNAFDPTKDPLESNLKTKQIDYNLSLGTLYSFSPNANYNFYLGFSAFNVTQPNISFFNGNEEKLERRYSIQTGAKIKLKNTWSLLPSAMFQLQGKNLEALFGSFVRYGYVENRKEKFGLSVGAWYRFKDALIPAIKAEYKNVALTMNFDINVSKLTPASRFFGSGEISVSYSGLLFKEHVKPKKPLYCPAFIY